MNCLESCVALSKVRFSIIAIFIALFIVFAHEAKASKLEAKPFTQTEIAQTKAVSEQAKALPENVKVTLKQIGPRQSLPTVSIPSMSEQQARSEQRAMTEQQATSAAAKVEEQFVIGRVLEVSDATVNGDLLQHAGMISNRQMVRIEIREGSLKGMTVTIPNDLTDNPAFNVHVRPGQEVVLSITTENGRNAEVNIADYHRSPALMWLGIVFLSAFLFFGGKTGLKSLLSLVVTVGLIAFILLPLSLQGFNPLLTAVFICLAATTTSMLLVAGKSKKALASVIGTVGGVIIAGVAAQTVITIAPLTGLSSEEAQILRGSLINQPPVFYAGLLAAGMLIGALGVIMDVGISIASAVSEVAKQGDSNEAALYESGMNVGRDIMGTMTNTLILAYAGGALPLLLIASQVPSIKLLNLDLVATEIASALSGSLGLVCTIPLTAYSAAKLMAGKKIHAKTVK